MDFQEHFEQVRELIQRGKRRALQTAYSEQLAAYWQVGAYVYDRLQSAEWGEKTVEQLATWLKEKEPTLKGFDRRSLYRMKEFFQTWHELDWKALKKDGSVIVATASPQLQLHENQTLKIVETASPQINEFPNILASLTWSHHIEILGRTGNLEEKVFYLLLAIRERYSVRDLKRQIDSGLYERQKLSKARLDRNQHPNADIIPKIFRDKYIFEFIDLPDPHTEGELQKALVRRLKQFILEIGRDFTFMGRNIVYRLGCRTIFWIFYFFIESYNELIDKNLLQRMLHEWTENINV
jgi:predicted nuclease of restriction endonuclease-like (RecB) superfamily